MTPHTRAVNLDATVDGVTIHRRLEPDEYPVPAVAYAFASSRDEPVAVTLTETLPPGLSRSDVGFHEDAGLEHWDAGDDELRFAYRLDPGERYETLFAVRNCPVPRLREIDLGEPSVVVTPPSDAGDEWLWRSTAHAPSSAGETPEPASGTAVGEGPPADADRLVEQLVAALRRGALDQEQLRALRDALDRHADGEDGEARVREGVAPERADRDDAAAHAGAVPADRLDDVEEDVAWLASRVHEYSRDLDNVEERLVEVRSGQRALADRLDEVEENAAFVENLRSIFD